MTNTNSTGWDDWCYDLDLAPTDNDRAIWIAYWDEELECNACCTAIRLHNNFWDRVGVYAWRYLHGPPPNPEHPGTGGGGHARAVTIWDPNVGRPAPEPRAPTEERAAAAPVRWTAARKLEVLKQIEAGELARARAMEIYSLTEEEIAGWERNFRRRGLSGLRTLHQLGRLHGASA